MNSLFKSKIMIKYMFNWKSLFKDILVFFIKSRGVVNSLIRFINNFCIGLSIEF